MATSSKHRPDAVRYEQAKRSWPDQDRFKESSTCTFPAPGFLNSSFGLLIGEQLAEMKTIDQLESCFLNSLGHLSTCYEIEALFFDHLEFPANLLQALDHAEEILCAKDPHLGLAFTETPEAICLAAYQSYDTGRTLYYLQLAPLYDLIRLEWNNCVAERLLWIFNYLIVQLEIPHPVSGGYMQQRYDMIRDWTLDDEYMSEEERSDSLQAWDDQFICSRELLDKIEMADSGRAFEPIPERTGLVGEFENKVNELIAAFTGLRKAHPEASLWSPFHPEFSLAGSDEDAECVWPEQYISFVWSFHDEIFDALEDTINCDMQEASVVIEPIAFQAFDAEVSEPRYDLEFVSRLFPMLLELAELLEALHEFNRSQTKKINHEKSGETIV